jgi:hypothetical protein
MPRAAILIAVDSRSAARSILIIGADFLRSPGDLNRFNFRIYLHENQ